MVLSENSIFPSSIHAFDLIVADECHRGYTAQEESKWREVLDHFDGAKIGLTATPAAHTNAFFKHMVYRYDYERAVKEGFLVDYDAVAVESDITINGAFLNEGEEVGLVDTGTGQISFEFLEDQRELPAPTTEIDWTAPDRNWKIIQEVKKYLLDQEKQLGHFPKTLIFAQNDISHISHCDQLIRILREEFNKGDDFVQKITGNPNVDRPLQRIREFRNREKPDFEELKSQIVISSWCDNGFSPISVLGFSRCGPVGERKNEEVEFGHSN
jgi:type I restriction enzyme R subunit